MESSAPQRGYHEMLSAVSSAPEQLSRGLALGLDAAQGLRERYQLRLAQRLIIAGVGGSAFPAELLKLMLMERGERCDLSRSYELPLGPGELGAEAALVICCSFSGNTEETIASYQEALRRGLTTVAISSGGELERLASSAAQPHLKLRKPSSDFQPRAATGLFLGALVGLLDGLGRCAGGAQELRAVAQELSGLIADEALTATGRALALELEGRVPVFYAPWPYGPSLAQVAKIKINENAKSPAFWAELPELNHNELIGYRRLNEPLTALIFLDDQAPPRMQRRAEATLKTLEELGLHCLTLAICSGEQRLARLLATLFIIDVASCELALRAGLNPNEVALLERFKRELGPFSSAWEP